MQGKNRFLIAMCVGMLIVSVVAATFLYAQGTGGETSSSTAATTGTPATPQRRSMAEMLKAGGLVGYTIIIINIGAVALALEIFMTLKRDKLCPPQLVGELEALLEEENYEEALALCDSNKSFLTNVMAAGIAKVGFGYEDMSNAMQEAGDLESLKLNNKINWLSLIYSISPMLGLFGTVTGMISAFQVIEQTANPSPKELARGIYEALVTTVEGLIVAIPTLTVYFYFKAKLSRLAAEIGLVSGELVERFKTPQQ
jgi:biopolymer transport protein ExbB